MGLCNIMTGAGFDTSFLGGLSMAWFGMVLIFFIIVFARKWLGEEAGMSFSIIGAFSLGYLSYIITVSLSCSYKIALIVGLICAGVGAYVVGPMLGDS